MRAKSGNRGSTSSILTAPPASRRNSDTCPMLSPLSCCARQPLLFFFQTNFGVYKGVLYVSGGTCD